MFTLVLSLVIANGFVGADLVIGNKNFSSLFTLSNAFADDTESNNNGSGMYFYEDRASDGAKTCTLYAAYNASGSLLYTSTKSISASGGITVAKVSGLYETCPKTGKGCTVYSCHQTSNTGN